MAKSIFTRHELKYVISYDKYEELVNEIRPFVSADTYGNEDGLYSITSIYFDSSDFKIYYETRNKAAFRQKLRLRVYNDAKQSDIAYVEIKQKFENVVNKRRTKLYLKNIPAFISNAAHHEETIQFPEAHHQTLNEIHYFRKLYNLDPKIWVRYERHAFQGKHDPDLRITFDYHLSCREETMNIEKTSEAIPFVDPNLVILEVKVDQSVPFWLTRILSKLHIQRGSLSKYCESVETLRALPDHIQQAHVL